MIYEPGSMTREQWIEAFVSYMASMAGFDCFDNGEKVADYARSQAHTYYDDETYRNDGPEACVDGDMDCWGDD